MSMSEPDPDKSRPDPQHWSKCYRYRTAKIYIFPKKMVAINQLLKSRYLRYQSASEVTGMQIPVAWWTWTIFDRIRIRRYRYDFSKHP